MTHLRMACPPVAGSGGWTVLRFSLRSKLFPSSLSLLGMDSSRHPDAPFRVACRFAGKDGYLVLDQLRTAHRERLVRRLGTLTAPTLAKALAVLQEMFAT
jgi:mRNA interferase MazF